MDTSHPVHGLWCAMLTPLDRSGGVDHRRFADHARRLLALGDRRGRAIRHHRRRPVVRRWRAGRGSCRHFSRPGFPPQRLVAATGCAALSETITLTRHGVPAGCAACLVLPPFFFKDLSRRRPVRLVRARHRGGRRHPAAHPALPHSAGDRRAAVGRPRSAPRCGVPRHHRRSQGQQRRVGEHRGAARARAAARDPRRPRAAPAARAARGRGRDDLRGGEHLSRDRTRAVLAERVPADEERIATFIDIAFRQPFLPAFKAIVAAQTGDAGWHACVRRGSRSTRASDARFSRRSPMPACRRRRRPATINEREEGLDARAAITAADLDALAAFDTPTICNALERLDSRTCRATAIRHGRSFAGSRSRSPSSATRAPR